MGWWSPPTPCENTSRRSCAPPAAAIALCASRTPRRRLAGPDLSQRRGRLPSAAPQRGLPWLRRFAAKPADGAAPPRTAGAQAVSLGGGQRRQRGRGGGSLVGCCRALTPLGGVRA